MIEMIYCKNKEQVADIFFKSFKLESFVKLKYYLVFALKKTMCRGEFIISKVNV